MYASLTTTTGSVSDSAAVAAMAGEAMVMWLREMEGFEGLLMLNDEAAGRTHVIALWRNREVAERHHEARMRLRDRITATVDVRVEETAHYDVPFAQVGGTRLDQRS